MKRCAHGPHRGQWTRQESYEHDIRVGVPFHTCITATANKPITNTIFLRRHTVANLHVHKSIETSCRVKKFESRNLSQSAISILWGNNSTDSEMTSQSLEFCPPNEVRAVTITRPCPLLWKMIPPVYRVPLIGVGMLVAWHYPVPGQCDAQSSPSDPHARGCLSV